MSSYTDGLSRRQFASLIAALPLLGARAAAHGAAGQAAVDQTGSPRLLPINTPKIDHLDVIVPNVEASARFYMGVFNTQLHAQPFQGGFRYFVLLNDLPENRQAGYIAIGDARGRGTYIGHFCTSVFNWRRDSAALMAALNDEVAKAGLGKLGGSGGIGGIFSDPDGIEIQFLPAPDTVVTAAVPSTLVEWKKGLVTPRGIDHVLLHVADLEKGVRFYRILYGMEASRDKNPDRVWFRIGDTRLGLQQASAGAKPHIEHYAIKVAPYDRAAVTAGLTKLGARVEPSSDEPTVLRFRDLDGISLELTV
jgi:catechol 2,3-dioxygenase-like lactoylglutathione lyase family enzyme